MDFLIFPSRDGGNTRNLGSLLSGRGIGSGRKRIRLVCFNLDDDALSRGELGGGVLNSASLPSFAYGFEAVDRSRLSTEVSRSCRAWSIRYSAVSRGGVGGGFCCCANDWNMMCAIGELLAKGYPKEARYSKSYSHHEAEAKNRGQVGTYLSGVNWLLLRA